MSHSHHLQQHPDTATPRLDPLAARLRQGWDEFVGPEASTLNHALTAMTTLVGSLGAAAIARRRGGGAVVATTAALLAADLVGGAYVNNTLASTRWYERPGQGDREHLLFAACHLHPALIAWMDRGTPTPVPGPVWAAAHYGYLLAATVAIRKFPQRRRLLGPALTATGLALDTALGRSRVLPWFAWTYYPKLLMGHASAALFRDEQLSAVARAESAIRP